MAAKAALELHTELRIAEPEHMTTEKLTRLGNDIGRLAGLIASSYFV
jgi:hypothetical protein